MPCAGHANHTEQKKERVEVYKVFCLFTTYEMLHIWILKSNCELGTAFHKMKINIDDSDR